VLFHQASKRSFHSHQPNSYCWLGSFSFARKQCFKNPGAAMLLAEFEITNS